jgi:MscS family membrane protein
VLFRLGLYLTIAIVIGVTPSLEGAEVNLETPRSAVKTHIENLQRDSYYPGKAAQAFYNGGTARSTTIAKKLKQIFDAKGLYVYYSQVPDVHTYKDTLTRSNTYVLFNQFPQIYLKKYGDKWYYSKETVEAIPELHNAVFPLGTDHLIDLIPQGGRRHFLGLAVWQYAGLGILILLSFLFYKIGKWLGNRLIHRLLAKVLGGSDATKYEKALSRSFSFLLVLFIVNITLPALQLPVSFSYYFFISLKFLIPIVVAFIFFRSLDILGVYMKWKAGDTETKLDDQLVPLLRKTLKVVTVIIGGLFVLQNLNFNITAILTGLSIGGLAFALAAQETIKNVFGSVMIFVDRPFQVGDYINVRNDVEGIVEEVGFRSTRVRTFDSSLVSIPNGRMADMVIDNMQERYQRHFYTTIGITKDTSPDVVENFAEGLRQIILDHPYTNKTEYYVRFNELADYSLNIIIWCYIQTQFYEVELKCREELLLSFMRLAEEMGVDFAFPTSTVHVEDFPDNASRNLQNLGPKQGNE